MKFPEEPPTDVVQLWYAIAPILVDMHKRLKAAEERLESFGKGPHVLTANDGSYALCGGPGVCQACDYPTKFWPGLTYQEWHGTSAAQRAHRQHFIPDYDSEGSY